VIWTKFFTDASIGVDFNVRERDFDAAKQQLQVAATGRGRAVPALLHQYIPGAPSLLEEDYAEEMDTPFGAVPGKALAQLAPLVVSCQSYALKAFA
jgi:hypothetical protein